MVNNKIIVIDDEKVVQEFVGRILTAKGYDVSFADNGLVGLEAVKRLLPSLIVLDIHMPEIDGLSLCQILKKDSLTSSIPILILSGEGRLGSVEDALKQGADSYVTKPFDAARLVGKIEALLGSGSRP